MRPVARGVPERAGPLVEPSEVPDWLQPLVVASAELPTALLRRIPAPPTGGRPAAVLMLFGEDGMGPGTGPDVLLLRRSDGLPSHPGQVAFPGGAVDATDDSTVAAALREASEEVGLDPSGVRPVALFPELFISPSGFVVTPVLGHWVTPSAVSAVDPAETAAVVRVPVSMLTDPANRFCVRHPSGWVGPAFALPDMLVWGFTAGLLAELIALAGWTQPWDESDVRELDNAWRDVAKLAASGPAGPYSSSPARTVARRVER
jgi:8-oxo-dGTP pyrophosphatase MutT (NUDIX family)